MASKPKNPDITTIAINRKSILSAVGYAVAAIELKATDVKIAKELGAKRFELSEIEALLLNEELAIATQAQDAAIIELGEAAKKDLLPDTEPVKPAKTK